jgi:hypothetical protein
MWRVVGAAGEPAATVLRISSGDAFDLILFRACGELSGSWAGNPGGTFVGSVDGFSTACLKTVPDGDPTPAWLASARAFRINGSDRELLAANGTVVATLLPGGKPRPVPDLISTLQQPPKLDPASIQKLRVVPDPLPLGAPPATPATILGKWLPISFQRPASGKPPYVQFASDGTWKSYDGCNGGGGRWAMGSGGDFIAIAGAIAGVGCAGPVTDIPVDKTRRAAISGGTLTLYTVDGQVLARLKR